MARGQQQLVLALRAASAGKPLIGVLVHGGTFAFGDGVLEALDAVLDVASIIERDGNIETESQITNSHHI